MLSRFNVSPILRGHFKGLTNGQYRKYRPDWATRAIFTAPGFLSVGMWLMDGRLAAPTPLLTAVALLAGGMLSAFTHLSTLRLKLTEWTEEDEEKFRIEREMLDETAAHLLMGSLTCAISAFVLVLGMNLSGSVAQEGIGGFWGALAAGLSLYVFLIFVVILPRLYSAYVEVNSVIDRLSGFSKAR